MELNLKEISELENVKFNNIENFSLEINNICIDSRKIQKDDLFIAIKGENFDGHDYIEKAHKNGAVAVVSEKLINRDIPNFFVDDTIKFLGKLAHFYKSKFELVTIGITGSCGKTTTKDMIAQILKNKYNVVYNKNSFNNNIGVPLTVFDINESTEILISELGMNHLREIDELSKIVEPDIAIITNIAPTHLEGLGSIQNVMKGKRELLENLSKNGTAILNWDDELVRKISRGFKFEIIKCSLKNKSDIKFNKIENENERYFITYQEQKFDFFVTGFHNVNNLLITCAVAEFFDLDFKEINDQMKNFKTTGNRLKIYYRNEIKIIDDCYNANPLSVEKAIEILNTMCVEGRKYFVFGDMAELGDYSEYYHKQIGEQFAKSKIDCVLLFGKEVEITYSVFQDKSKIFLFNEKKEILDFLEKHLKKGDCVMLKGSRKMKLETITEQLFVSGE